MSSEPLTFPVNAYLVGTIQNINIVNEDEFAMSFDVTALTADRQLVIPDAKSMTVAFNTTSIATLTTLPSGANNTFYGIGAGSDVTTGTGNVIIGQNAQAGSATAINRVVLGGTGVYDDYTHISTTNVDIPNLPSNVYNDVVLFNTDTGKLSHAPIASFGEWADGTAASPGQRFTSDTDTGFYRVTTNTVGIAAGGAISASFSTTQALFLNGAVGAPGISFISDTDTGIYRIGANDMGIACGGVLAARVGPAYLNAESNNTWQTAININNTTSTRQYGLLNGGSANTTLGHTDSAGVNIMALYVAGTGANVITQKWTENQTCAKVGTAALPSFSFFEDNNTGMYRSAADTLAWSTNGTLRLSLNTTALTNTLPYYAPDGSHSAPSYSFASDTDTGFYRSASDEITFNVGLATNTYPLRINAADNVSSRRDSDTGAFSGMTNLQAYGNGFAGVIYRAYVQTPFTTNYSFARFENNGGAAFRIRGDGATFADGAYTSPASDYAEWFEAKSEIPVGTTVVLQDGKIREAQMGEESKILGVVRPKTNTNCCVVIGNSAEEYWNDKFEKDEYGQFITENVSYYQWTDQDGKHHGYYSHQIPNGVVVPDNKEVTNNIPVKKLNPDYDPNQVYVPRSQRPEWHVVGMFGQIPVKNGQVLGERWQLIKNVGDGSIAKMYLVV